MMLFNLATIVNNLKNIFFKGRIKYFIFGGMIILIGKIVFEIFDNPMGLFTSCVLLLFIILVYRFVRLYRAFKKNVQDIQNLTI